jgi:pimeloyl-ACP methyl ester carboxylesterase
MMREHWHMAANATQLYARDFGPLDQALTPLLCLPGLTRNSLDFEPVFRHFAPSRRVIAMDFRGRGRSAHAADPLTYRPDVELQDTLEFLDALGLVRVTVLGTSRGGLVGLLMGTLAKTRLAGLCLNDVGCKLEAQGLLRIMAYVGTAQSYRSWAAAASAFETSAVGFDAVSPGAWEAVVQRIYREDGGRIVHSHDLALNATLPTAQDVASGKIPELWSLLPALVDLPFAVLRGEGSDLLSLETVEKMADAVPDLVVTTVPGRGHVPFLDEPASVAAIEHWLERVDLLN